MKTFLRAWLAVMLLAVPLHAAEINSLDTTDNNNVARFPEGMTFANVNNSARALEGILARFYKDVNGSLTTAGSSNAYTLDTNETFNAYYTGMWVRAKASFSNTGAATLNIESLGAKTIKKGGTTDVVQGDIVEDNVYDFVYDGTNLQVLNPTLGAEIPYSLIQDMSATSRVLGRVSSGAGVIEEVTLTQLLDFIGSAAQGDILYRDSSAWARLGAGTADMALLTGGAAANPAWGYAPGALIAIIEDRKSSGTSGGTATSGSDQTRVLNTLAYNRDTLVALSSNRFTLPAGSWEISWSMPFRAVNEFSSILRDITASADVVRGTNGETDDALGIDDYSFGHTAVTVSEETTYELRYRVQSTRNTDGLGRASSQGTETYARVVIRAN